jgi:hypothetical protein
MVSFAFITKSGDPSNFQETINSIKNTKGKKAISCKWSFRRKEAAAKWEFEHFKLSWTQRRMLQHVDKDGAIRNVQTLLNLK